MSTQRRVIPTSFVLKLYILLSQLDQMCLGKTPDLGDITTTGSLKQNTQAILDLLEQSGQVKSAQAGQSTSLLTALHLITSAIDGEKTVFLTVCIMPPHW